MQPAVVVTGASTGIGKATALKLDAFGYRVYAGVRREKDAEELAARASPKLTSLILDVTDKDSRKRAFETVAKTVDGTGIAGLVNNAGIFIGGPLEFVALEDLRLQFEVNVIGQVAVTQTFLPLLRTAQGRVILMSSISGRIATPLLGPYAASKFALEALADSLRVELSLWSIPVSLIEPGNVATPMWTKTLSQVQNILQRLPRPAADLYQPVIKATIDRATRRGNSGLHPDIVAKTILRALTVPKPKPRYLVGLDAHLQALLVWLLPDRALDALIRRSMGLHASTLK